MCVASYEENNSGTFFLRHSVYVLIVMSLVVIIYQCN